MSAPPPPPHSSLPPPPPLVNAAGFHASSGFHSELHHVPPPPGVSSAPLVLQKPNFLWSPSPALTPMPATTQSPPVAGGVYPQQASIPRNFFRANENNFQSWPPRSNIQSPGEVVPGMFLQQPLASQAGFSYGPENAASGTQKFSHASSSCGHNTMIPDFSLDVPVLQDPSFTQRPPAESNSTHGSAFSQLNTFDKIDMKDLIPKLRVLIIQANESVEKILCMLKMSHDTLPFQGLDPKAVGSAGLNCASPRISEGCAIYRASWDCSENSGDIIKARTIFSNILRSLKNRKILDDLFYKDAPGVVQVPVYTVDESLETSKLPDFAVGERWDELMPQGLDAFADNRQAHQTLLPSRYWLVSKEVSEWKDLPEKLTPFQLKAMDGLVLVQQADLQRWLLTHGCSYGLRCSRSLAEQIVILLVFCLRAVHRESIAIIDSGEKVGMVDIRVLSQSADWLSAQLSFLYGAASSKNLVLGLYKFALTTAAHCSVISPHRGSLKGLQEEKSSKADNDGKIGVSLEQEPHNPCKPSVALDDPPNGSACVGDGVLCLQRLASAILAIQAQAACDKCRGFKSLTCSTHQRAAEHSMVTNKATEVRATRADYRAVLEHDGLIWQRPQNQESKRNKTKEELLAEERDYKRRRMSYRGKKVQRTPAEVLRDIIEGHMADIVAAGGIGYIGRRTQDAQSTESEALFSALGAKDHINTYQKSMSSSRDSAGTELRTSHQGSGRYSKAENRDSCRTESPEQHRLSGLRHDQNYQERAERSREHSDENSFERKYDSTRNYSRRESKHRGERHHSSRNLGRARE